MYIVLELGDLNLKEYFHKTIREQVRGEILPRTNEDILIKIIKGAAKALKQFHKFGIHGDIKSDNFVVSLEQNPELDFIELN
ncbi:Protein kinase domain-containing protein [Meloidogyne graminicola]|uniref:Protein kinase domain-containing protein n=1 Tax=Meloidogyne graminicola TaxID=189291 RepID=A0A8S9ZHI0_9BILA|nr:Protein kinase domain-containing protein [Meloidogyne graminicola]